MGYGDESASESLAFLFKTFISEVATRHLDRNFSLFCNFMRLKVNGYQFDVQITAKIPDKSCVAVAFVASQMEVAMDGRDEPVHAAQGTKQRDAVSTSADSDEQSVSALDPTCIERAPDMVFECCPNLFQLSDDNGHDAGDAVNLEDFAAVDAERGELGIVV